MAAKKRSALDIVFEPPPSPLQSVAESPSGDDLVTPVIKAVRQRITSALHSRRRVVRRTILPSALRSAGASGLDQERAMLVDYLKMLSWWLGRPPLPAMPRRLEQTLMALLRGRSEKQIARDLGVSIHTVHDYVKNLHKRFNVMSRGELLIKFLPFKGDGPPRNARNS